MSYKILVIDHDPDSFEEMMRPLISAGYEVVLATDADQGLDTFERMHPDLTMIEAYLPQRTGPELCQQLRQTEFGTSTPIVLIHDADRGEQARQSLDGCDCNQIIDRPITDELLLDLCQRLLPAQSVAEEPVAEGSEAGEHPQATQVEAAADPDTFLNNEQLGDALGRLNLIIDGETDKPKREKALDVAEQRGDFSYIADELKAVDRAPIAAKAHDAAVAAGPGPQTTAAAEPAAATHASPPPSATTPPAGLPETMASDDLGDDISAHLDTLFGGGETASPASDETAGATAHEPTAEAPAAPAESAAPSPVVTRAAPAPQSSVESHVETPAAPAPAAVRPAPPRVAHSQTEAAVPPAARKPVPTPVSAAVPHQAATGRSKLWLAAASIAVVILGGGLALFFMRGSSPDPVAAIPDTPARESSGSQTIASAGLSAREAAPALPVTLPQQTDATEAESSIVDPAESSSAVPTEPEPGPPPATQTSPKPQKAPAQVAKPDPPKPEPKRATPPKPKPKPKPKVSTPRAEPTPVPPKPAPEKVADARPRPPAPKPAEPAVQSPPQRVTVPQPAPATAADATSVTAGDAEKTTSPPTPAPERVEPVTEIARLNPRPEPAARTPSPSTAATPKAATVFRPPVVVERVEPVYSRKARKKDERGTIVINVLVGEDGRIARVVVDRGIPGSELEAAAMNAVVRWKFEPATEGGKPVKAWTKAEFVFD